MKRTIYNSVENIAFLISVISMILFMKETSVMAAVVGAITASITLFIENMKDEDESIEEGHCEN